MDNVYTLYLHKNEDAEAYKKFASQGADLMFPVRIKNRTHRPDINIPYHATIKLFDTSKDKMKDAHDVASNMSLNPPNAKEVQIEPTTLKGRTGYTIHVLKLHGPHVDNIKEHHKKFAHMGYKENYEYHPHVSVDPETWHHIVKNGFKTAHEAGLEFMPAELHHKDKVIANYKPKVAQEWGKDPHKEDKLAASEKFENSLEKSIFRNIGIATAMGAALAGAHPAQAPEKPASGYSTQRMLRTIANVESGGGQHEQHRPTSHGTAYGKYALMPNTIRDTIKMNPDLSVKHKKATMLHGSDLNRYMQDNPGLEDSIAEKHVKRLEHHFGQNPSDIGFAWLNGVSGTYKAKKDKQDINSHWHVKKIRDAYGKGQ